MRVTDREALIIFLERVMAAMGIAGTLLAVVASSQPWLVHSCIALLILVLSAIIVDAVYYLKPFGIPWRKVRLGIDSLINKFTGKGFLPDIIFGVGRSGSIVGATLAANLGHCPFVGLDVQHKKGSARRLVKPNGPISFSIDKLDGKKVLVVFGNLRTGQTFRAVRKYLTSQGVNRKQLSYATLFLHPDAPVMPEKLPLYFAYKRAVDEKHWSATPWHIREEYEYR